MLLTPEQIAELQYEYRGLTNYQSDDPMEAIDPTSYRAPDGDRLIHFAAFRGDVKTIQILLDAGDDINAAGDMGSTPAHYAAMGKHKAAFDLIMSRGADPTIMNEFGATPYEFWVHFANNDTQGP